MVYTYRIDLAAVATITGDYMAFSYPVTVQSIRVVLNDTVAKHAANYFTLTVGDGTNTISTVNTSTGSGVAFAAGVAQSLTVDSLYSDFEAGETMKFEVAKAGGGEAFDGLLSIEVLPKRG